DPSAADCCDGAPTATGGGFDVPAPVMNPGEGVLARVDMPGAGTAPYLAAPLLSPRIAECGPMALGVGTFNIDPPAQTTKPIDGVVTSSDARRFLKLEPGGQPPI